MKSMRPAAADTAAARASGPISGRKSDSVGGPNRPTPREELGPSGDSVRAPWPADRVFRRRIPSAILDDLPESLVDPVDQDEGVLQVTKGDDRGFGGARGVQIGPEPRTESPVSGRTITLVGSPVKGPAKFTYFGHYGSDQVAKDFYSSRPVGPDYVARRRSSPGRQNPSTQSLVCQKCSGGTVFGLYQTPKPQNKYTQGDSSAAGFRKSHSLSSSAPHEAPLKYPVNEKLPDPRFRTIYYDNPQHQRRLERYGQSSHRASREISVTGLQDFCRTMLTVKNASVDYNQGDTPLHHGASTYQPNTRQQQNQESYRSAHFVNGHQSSDVKSNSTFANGSFQHDKARSSLQQQEQVKPSPTLRSPKLVKEVLKKMASHPSGQLQVQYNAELYSDDDDNFVDDHRIPRAGWPDSEAMRIMDEFDKALTAGDTTVEMKGPAALIPSAACKLEPANSHSAINITHDNKPSSAGKVTRVARSKVQYNSKSDCNVEENFVVDHRVPKPEWPDSEAGETTVDVKKPSALIPSVTFKLQPASSHSAIKITQENKSSPTGKEHESQSDNLIEEIEFSGTEMKRQALQDKMNNIFEKENLINALNISQSHAIAEMVKDESSSRSGSPAPPKPPRNYDSLPRGFKPSLSHSSVDVVPSDAYSVNNGTQDGADSGVCSPQQNYFVVVAIDFGTTYSGYAFSFTRDPESIHMMRKWEGGDAGVLNQKTPTTLLLTPDEKFHSFGYAARDSYHNLDHKEAKKWLYFEKFKMTLHKNENLSRDTCITAANGKSLPAVTVFAHSLRYFKEHALQELSDQSATNIVNEDIRWVVTVPAIWRQPAKQFMRNASYEAGIACTDLPEQLMIALEPEAASIFCRRLRMHQLVPSMIIPQRLSLPNIKDPSDGCTEPAVIENKGIRYMVVDCGGGTVDINVHEIVDEQGTIRELHKATGGPYGSMGIDIEFEKLLNDIFGADFMGQFKVNNPVAFIELMVGFEARKRNASPFKIMPLNISLPFSFIDCFRKAKGCKVEDAIKKYGNKEIQWSSQGMLRLDPLYMQRLFQPTLDAIKKHIEVVLEHPGVQDIGYLFLVGGFSESQILQKSVRDSFSSCLKVIIPQDMSLAILKGAVLFGLDPTVINARRSRLTYGVGVLNRFVHGVHPKDKLVVKDGVEYCADVFDKFVVSDQSVCVGDMVIREYTPARLRQACSVIHIYCSERDDANFITDPKVQRCGTLILDLMDSKYNSASGRREIQTVMIFGDTELKVSAVDVATGKCVKAEVDFFIH